MAETVRTTLLIVDDEAAILMLLAASLEHEFEVLKANSAEEAKELLTHREAHIVLTDLSMPGANGIQLLEWIREHRPRAKRMLMAGYSNLADVVEAVNRGQVYRFLLKPCPPQELLPIIREAARDHRLEEDHRELLNQLRQLNQELEARVQERTRELEEANAQLQQRNSMLEKLALTDALTGLPNRRAIEQILQTEIRRRTRYPTPLSVGLIDADHFKDVNTRHLITGGDQVLVQLAKTLSGSLRGVDTIGRLGGEEFLAVAPVTSMEGAGALGERIRHAVEQMAVEYQGQVIKITVSVGFAVAEQDAYVSPAELTHQAAFALAEAKAGGRNRCVLRLISSRDTVRAASSEQAS